MSTMNINKRNLYTTASALVLSGPLVAQQPNIILFWWMIWGGRIPQFLSGQSPPS